MSHLVEEQIASQAELIANRLTEDQCRNLIFLANSSNEIKRASEVSAGVSQAMKGCAHRFSAAPEAFTVRAHYIGERAFMNFVQTPKKSLAFALALVASALATLTMLGMVIAQKLPVSAVILMSVVTLLIFILGPVFMKKVEPLIDSCWHDEVFTLLCIAPLASAIRSGQITAVVTPKELDTLDRASHLVDEVLKTGEVA